MSMRVLPEGGLEHPVFRGLGPADQINVVATWRRNANEAELAEATDIVRRWSETEARADKEEPCHCDEPWVGPAAVRARVHNLLEPKVALERLVSALGKVGPGLAELHLARWLYLPRGDQHGLALHPKHPADELTDFPTHDDYVRALFDLAGPTPASEYEQVLKGAFETRHGDVVTEDRGMPLFFEGMRLGYGTVRAGFTPPDARTFQVAKAVRAALDAAFAPLVRGSNAKGPWPQLFDRMQKLGMVDRLTFGHRIGYGFALPSSDLVHRATATRFRFREQELFEALQSAIATLELAPVISWQRFGKPFAGEMRFVELHVVQLWEPGRNFAPVE